MGRSLRSADPTQRLGIWKTESDVPDGYRLRYYARQYNDRDTWREWCEARGVPEFTRRAQKDIERAGRRWKAHIEKQTDAPHHALCQSEDVESWFRSLLEDRGLRVTSTQSTHAVHLRRFYGWLATSTSHPHRYDPVMMAYADPANECARKVWRQKLLTDGRDQEADSL